MGVFTAWLVGNSIIFISIITRCVVANNNILLGKPITLDFDQSRAKLLNDGDQSTCIWTNKNPYVTILIDLGDVYKIDKIITYNRYFWVKQNFSIFIGNELEPCYKYENIRNYRTCVDDVGQTTKVMEHQCRSCSNEGQYLAIVVGSLDSKVPLYNFDFCEIEAFGKKIKKGKTKSKPTFHDKGNWDITYKDFDITTKIIKDGMKVKVPYYSSTVVSAAQNCQPIIWVKSKASTFAQACYSPKNKGRIALFGKYGFVGDLTSDKEYEELKVSLFKWLLPKAEKYEVVSTRPMTTKQDLEKAMKNANIVEFYADKTYDNDFVKTLLKALFKGKIAVLVNFHDWGNVKKYERSNLNDILKPFYIDVIYKFITWSSPVEEELKYKDLDKTYFGFKDKMEYILKSHQYFIDNVEESLELLKTASVSTLSKDLLQSTFLKILKKYNGYLEYIKPCKLNPLSDSVDRELIKVLGELGTLQTLQDSGYKYPGVDLFPGDFVKDPPKTSSTVEITAQTSRTLHPTGLYLKAGDTLKYKVLNSKGLWKFSIGCATDRIPNSRTELTRYPNMYVNKVPIEEEEGSIYSAYGGPIWLFNKDTSENISIEINNVVLTPFFNLKDPKGVEKWNTVEKNHPGLWAQIAGDNMVICQETKLVKDYSGEYLAELMGDIWDNVVKADYVMKGLDWHDKKAEISILDVQISAGSGHSGYPIGLHDYWHDDVFNLTRIKTTGSWGMFHEIGHNMQERKWTFSGLGEVTNNLLGLFNYDKIVHLPYLGSSKESLDDRNLEKDLKEYFEQNNYEKTAFTTWKKEPFVALMIYAQLANQMGWGFFNEVFKYYNTHNINPTNDDDKIKTWINVTSIVSKQNLVPLFEFWGIPVDTELKSSLKTLECFIPNDFFTELGVNILTKIKLKYPNCHEKSSYKKDFIIDSLISGRRTNNIFVKTK